MNLREIVDTAGKVAQIASNIIRGSDTKSDEQKQEPINRVAKNAANAGVFVGENTGVIGGDAKGSFVGKSGEGDVTINN